MKKYITITFLCLLTTKIAFSQNDSLKTKGRTFISGYYGLSKYTSGPVDQNKNSNSYKFSDYYLKASLGKFIRENTVRIISIGYGQRNQNVEFKTNTSNLDADNGYFFSGGYAIEKYKMFTPNFGIFAGIEGNISYSTASNDRISESYTSSNVSVNLNSYVSKTSLNTEIFIYPGLIYFINSKWAITTQIGYLQLFNSYSQRLKQSQEYLSNNEITRYNTTENNSGCNFNPSFFMGGSGISVRYHLK